MTDQARINLSLAADAAIHTLGYCRAAYWSDEHCNYLHTQAIESLRKAAAALGYDLVKESGRSVEYGEEDAFRRGEWFESGDLQKVEAAYVALAEGTPT